MNVAVLKTSKTIALFTKIGSFPDLVCGPSFADPCSKRWEENNVFKPRPASCFMWNMALSKDHILKVNSLELFWNFNLFPLQILSSQYSYMFF